MPNTLLILKRHQLAWKVHHHWHIHDYRARIIRHWTGAHEKSMSWSCMSGSDTISWQIDVNNILSLVPFSVSISVESYIVLPNSIWNSYAAVSKSKEHQILLLWLSSTGQEFTLQATDVKKLSRRRFGNCRLLLLPITFATGLTSICDQSIAPHCSINEQNNTNGCLTETISKSAVWGVMHSSYARQLMTIFILFAWINNKWKEVCGYVE